MFKTLLFSLLASFVCVAVLSGSSQAQDIKHYSFTFGLKAKELRTVEEIEALEKRLAQRCRASMMVECRFALHRLRTELEVSVSSPWSLEEVQSLLTARGELRVFPVAFNVLAFRPFLPSAKDPIDWERDSYGDRGEDIYFHSKDGAALQKFARDLQDQNVRRVGSVTIRTGPLGAYRLWVGPTLVNDRVQGYRIYATQTESTIPAVLGTKLEGVHVLPQGNPPFFILALRWSETPPDDKTPSGAQELQALTRAVRGWRILVTVDDQPIGTVSIPEEVTDGELRVRMPANLSTGVQQNVARKLAGRIAGGAHPCEIAVVKAKRTR